MRHASSALCIAASRSTAVDSGRGLLYWIRIVCDACGRRRCRCGYDGWNECIVPHPSAMHFCARGVLAVREVAVATSWCGKWLAECVLCAMLAEFLLAEVLLAPYAQTTSLVGGCAGIQR